MKTIEIKSAQKQTVQTTKEKKIWALTLKSSTLPTSNNFNTDYKNNQVNISRNQHNTSINIIQTVCTILISNREIR